MEIQDKIAKGISRGLYHRITSLRRYTNTKIAFVSMKCGLSIQRSYVTFIHLLTRCSILFYIDISHRFCANCKILCLKLLKRTKELLK